MDDKPLRDYEPARERGSKIEREREGEREGRGGESNRVLGIII